MKDAKFAITAARETFDNGERKGTKGARQTLRIAELMERDKEEVAEIGSLDTRKTVEESRKYMDDITGVFGYYGGL